MSVPSCAQMSFTTSQVRRAGQTLRRWLREDAAGDVEWAIEVLAWYRRSHRYALAGATRRLRWIVRSEGRRIEVSQRLKRTPTIIGKLQRQPTLQLSQMQDIGGCRAVLASIHEVRQVERRLCEGRRVLRVSDYIAAPKSSGYRGVHVVIEHRNEEGEPRSIEVQLRTTVMHEWATSVEELSGTVQEDLKSGYGPTELLTLLGALSEAMAIEESGEVVPREHVDRISLLRRAAVPFLARTSR